MARLAQSQANYCSKIGRLIHSNRYAFQGGENLAGGKGNLSPRTIVNIWLKSKKGHREYLLSPRVRKAGVGISKSKGNMYAAWAFSDKPPTYPDCPYCKPHKPKPRKLKGRGGRNQAMKRLLWSVLGIFGGTSTLVLDIWYISIIGFVGITIFYLIIAIGALTFGILAATGKIKV